MNISNKICEFNKKIDSIFGRFKVKTHKNVQIYSDKTAEYFAEIHNTQLVDEIVYYDDEYDVFCFFIITKIDYENLKGYGSSYRVREHVKGEFVFITKQEIVNQITAVDVSTLRSKDTYLLSSVISQLMLSQHFLVSSANLDTSQIEKRYFRDNVFSVEHKILSFTFDYISDNNICFDFDCLFESCVE